MNYKKLIAGLFSAAISYSLSAAVAVQGGYRDPYAFGQRAPGAGYSAQGSEWMDISQASKSGYTSVEYDPQAPTWMRESQPISQPERRKALVIHQDEDPNADSGGVDGDQHVPQLMVEQPQQVVQVVPQKPAVLLQINQPKRPENQHGLRGNKPKLLELSNRAMKERFFLDGGYRSDAEHLAVISRRGMRNHINKIRKTVKTLKHDSMVLTKELNVFCRDHNVLLSSQEISQEVERLKTQWNQQEDRYIAPEKYHRAVSYWSTWSDCLWDTFNPFSLIGLLRKNYRAKYRLNPAMKSIYDDITQIRQKSMYNHIYIGLIIQAMGQTKNEFVLAAMERLRNIRYSLSKETQIKKTHEEMMYNYTDSLEREVIPMLETVLDFYTEVHIFNRKLSDFWAHIKRALTPNDVMSF